MKLIRYFGVGGASALIDFAVFALLVNILGRAEWFAAAAASFVVATAFNYVLSVRLVFSAGARFSRGTEILLVFAASLGGLALNQATIWLCYQMAGWNLWLAKVIATGSAFLWNFAARNSFIFRVTR